ncbi:hypothetical protein SADUNF_Sadunf03G0136800 [Salix dunnii]|uniref:Uncharacterized protein n=1 Tax=Salix dunnii TaxID=1413687 RepID=A0A835N4Q3_9ROSI|nr:hypothetical protein SADUNF_Sadunf03G0136800 [Salix dunnii]
MHGISIHRENIQRDISSLTSLTVLLAASGQKRCTSLVCSCYVSSRNFNNRGEESNKTEKGSFAEKKEYGVMEEVSAYESVQDHQKSNGGRDSRSSGPSGSSNGPHLETSTLKSNLKKTASTTTIEENQEKIDHQKRKVRWPDIAYGTDIAHVLEFEPRLHASVVSPRGSAFKLLDKLFDGSPGDAILQEHFTAFTFLYLLT